MNHIYLNEAAVNSFAQQLAQSEYFLDHSFMLYADVPLKCLKYEGAYFPSGNNLATMDPKTAVQTVDFLVCSGTEVVLAVTFDLDVQESQRLFDSVLKGIPYITVESAAFDRENAPELAQKVLDFLEPCFTDEHSKVPYSLLCYAGFPLPQSELRRKQLISSIGYITPYGRDCGLFFQCELDDSGALTKNPVTTVRAEQGFMDAMYRYGAAPGKDDGYALRALLNTPVEKLFGKYEEYKHKIDCLTMALQAAPELQGIKLETYGDYLELVYRRVGTMTEDNPENKLINDFRKEILSLLAVPLSDPQTSPILGMSLRSYFEEAALLGQFDYPNWLYRSRFCPYLNRERFSDQKYTLAQAVQHALNIDSQAHPKKASFPTLYELLVLPICCSNVISAI